ncbi:unnamed protein product [Rotaria socialis]|uniref:F-box domain-containing protein n=1 Tax=Rotaria socialis TaxID=392032 RepID=A0A818PW37_9BILA|nr:unnamed protein product [Rotaria socialis]
MNILNKNDFNILDLPDEILLVTLNKLNTTDVFHSLVDVNQQFDRLALHYLYVRNIDMTDTMTITSLYDQTSSINTKILSKISEKVLPRIHHQVYKLTIEQYSMQRIILAANYPQLYCLSLINFQKEILYQYLTASTSHMSSTLIRLKINVASLVDCLYLLDGRLDSLSTLVINVGQILDPILDVGSREKASQVEIFLINCG